MKRKSCGFLTAGLRLFFLVLCIGFPPQSPLADQQAADGVDTLNHRLAIEAWRTARHERLKQPDGWLTLVGLEWLNEGENRIGKAQDNDIQLSGGPDYWGTVTLQEDRLSFTNIDPKEVKVNGESIESTTLVADIEGEPTVISAGTMSINVIFRESYALRIKDSQAEALQNFKGVDNYPIDESWRISSRFIAAPEGTVMEITNVLGQVFESPVFGTFEFERDGKTHSMQGLGTGESETLWFIFADRTTGHGSYGAGRYLYSDGMPESGVLTVDFNKAYNPPCAFNEYSTCPIPPQQNRMDVWVESGEKDYHPDVD